MKIIEYPCLPIKQGKYKIVVFSIPAKELFALVKINRREIDKQNGYQRALQPNRTNAIAKFIDDGNAIPTNIVVAFDAAKVTHKGKCIQIQATGDAGWVIDGQHRLAGAFEARHDIDLAVTAFLDLKEEDQVGQFIIINREAKRVPTSLYLDLLPDLKTLKKNESEHAKERAVDLANSMKSEETSPFFNSIVSLKSPSRGQLSLTNWVRKIAPLVHRTTGVLRVRNETEQRSMLENYFLALKDVFPKDYEDSDCVFFRTVGFGGVMNAFTQVHDITLRRKADSFTRADIVETLKPISDFPFSEWKKLGTGSAAELGAGKQLSDELLLTHGSLDTQPGTLKL
jgi:DGQHR domain-containing protein